MGWDNDVIGVVFSCTSAHTSWDAAARSHALAISCNHTSCYAAVHSRALAHKRHPIVAVHWGGVGGVGIITSLALRSHALPHRLYALRNNALFLFTYIYIYIFIDR